MPDASVSDALRAALPHLSDLHVTPAGEGDYCRALLVDHTWLFLFAKHPHASACLERAARVLPTVSAGSPVPIPHVEHHGHAAGLAYVGYRPLPGVELTVPRFAALPSERRRELAQKLAAFFRHLHAFDPGEATRLGVPVSTYGFAMRDDELLLGPAEDLYRRDLGEFAAWPEAGAELTGRLEAALEEHLQTLNAGPGPLVLLHNEVSVDHVLHDPETGRPTGLIDFNGMVVGRPARDFLYLYGEYGPGFASEVLRAYGRVPLGETLGELRFLHLWHVLTRLLWAVEHGYGARAGALQTELGALLGG